jgi:hypothetical protein
MLEMFSILIDLEIVLIAKSVPGEMSYQHAPAASSQTVLCEATTLGYGKAVASAANKFLLLCRSCQQEHSLINSIKK